MTKFTPQDLSNGVQGDFEAFSLLLKQQHSTLENCRHLLVKLVLTTADVHGVLLKLQREQVSPSLVQQWASFVRRGYIANHKGQAGVSSSPIKPIQIDYDPHSEAEIAETISRLDEIGDLVDGEVTATEVIEMLNSLPGLPSKDWT